MRVVHVVAATHTSGEQLARQFGNATRIQIGVKVIVSADAADRCLRSTEGQLVLVAANAFQIPDFQELLKYLHARKAFVLFEPEWRT